MTDFQDEYSDDDDAESASSYVHDPKARDRGTRVRAWIAGLLAILAVLIFVGDRFFVLVKPNLDRIKRSRQAATMGEFEQSLRRVLGDYGIPESWVKTHAVRMADSALERNEWMISIPRDVAIASINHDIKETLEPYGALTFAVENAKTRQVTIHIRVAAFVRYSLIFTPSETARRQAGRLVFMVDKIADAPTSEFEALLACKDPVIGIVTPSRDVLQRYDQLRLARKDVILHVHVSARKTDASQYALSDDLGEADVRKKLRVIVKTFRGASAFFLTSDKTPSASGVIVQEELQSNGLRRIDPTLLSYLDRTLEDGNMSSRVNDVSSAAVKSGTSIGVAELKDGIIAFLISEMNRLRKRGFKFIRPTEL
jgi:polysaccharide deacetylase 2 family uncharacterized protein YibQ